MSDIFGMFGDGGFSEDRLGVGEPLFRSMPSEYGDQTVGDGQGDQGDQGSAGNASDDGQDDADSGEGAGGAGSADDDQGEGSNGGGGGGGAGGDGQGGDDSSANLLDALSRSGLTDEELARRGLSPEQITQLQRSLADDISSSASKGVGNAIPESAVEWAADVLLPPVLPLHDLFRDTLGRIIDTSRQGGKATYRRRSRRQDSVGGKVMLPGKARAVREVMVGIDVSGSRTDDELCRDFAEITAIAETKGFRVRYFSVSTVHHEVRDLQRGDRPVFDRDYAGTDMRMAFEVFDAHEARARILMTDGYTGWPSAVRSGTETLVTITSSTLEEFERVKSRVPAALDTVWLPPAGVEGREP